MPSTTFEAYPFPDGLAPNIPDAEYASDARATVIADAARCLNQLREHWLNPSELVKCVPEVVPGYPDRLIPINTRPRRNSTSEISMTGRTGHPQ